MKALGLLPGPVVQGARSSPPPTTARQQPPPPPRCCPQRRLCRAACVVYLLHSLPSVLFPTGILATVLTLVAGVLLGLGGATGALVSAPPRRAAPPHLHRCCTAIGNAPLAVSATVCRGLLRAHPALLYVLQALTFYRLTHPHPGDGQQGHEAALLQPRRGALKRRAAAGATGSSATAPGSTLPHAIAVGGAYSGVVYTAPASGWRREATVTNWPPTVDPSLPFRAWQATVEEGTLVLRPILPPPGAKPPSPGRDKKAADGKQHGSSGSGSSGDSGEREQAAAAAAAAAAPSPAATVAAPSAAAAAAASAAKVGIPLEGCTVELVTDGLNGRSDLIRRAPLLVSHPRWKLLDGEPAFYLWAGGCPRLSTGKVFSGFALVACGRHDTAALGQ